MEQKIKFSVKATDLIPTLKNHILKIKSVKTDFSILSTVKFTISGNDITLISSDMQTFYRSHVEIRNEGHDTSFCLDIKYLEMLVYFTQPEIIFESEPKGVLKVKNGKFTGKFLIVSAADYLEMLVDALEEIAPISYKQIAEITPFVSTDTTQHVLNGVLFERTADKFSLCAIDGRRLILDSVNTEKSEIIGEWIVPQHVLNLIVKMKMDSVFYFDKKNNRCFFGLSDGSEVTTFPLDGKFPNYKMFIPKEFTLKNSVTFSRREYETGVKAIGKMIDKESNKVIWTLQKDSILLSAKNTDYGVATYEIDANIKSDISDVQIGLNSKLMPDILDNLESDKVTMYFSDHEHQCCFSSKKGDYDRTMVMMPMRVTEEDV